MRLCKCLNKKGFALISTLLFLPMALTLLIFCVQLLFFYKIKNELLQECFLYSLENVNRSADQKHQGSGLNGHLVEKLTELSRTAPISFFRIKLEFEPVQMTNLANDHKFLELASHLQLSVISLNVKFESFTQSFKCGAFLKWKDSRKVYGIIAVKY